MKSLVRSGQAFIRLPKLSSSATAVAFALLISVLPTWNLLPSSAEDIPDPPSSVQFSVVSASLTADPGFSILAGAEGFEPPSPVLETGSLTVELTPLKPAHGFQLSAKCHCVTWPSRIDAEGPISFPCATCACDRIDKTC